MLFFRPMYLQGFNIHCYRCSFLDQSICNLLFFELADTFKPACHVQLHLHLAFSITWGYSPQKFCILNPLFLYLADTSRRNFASSTCPFYTLLIHPTEFLHPHFQKIHYRRYRHSISFEFYLLHNLSQYITYKKIDIRNSSEYGVSVGDT